MFLFSHLKWKDLFAWNFFFKKKTSHWNISIDAPFNGFEHHLAKFIKYNLIKILMQKISKLNFIASNFNLILTLMRTWKWNEMKLTKNWQKYAWVSKLLFVSIDRYWFEDSFNQKKQQLAYSGMILKNASIKQLK